MSIPRHLSPDYCDFRYTQLNWITDVNSILTALTAQLVTAPAAAHKWTEAPAGTFTSPSDSEGRYLVCAFSRIAAGNLQMVLTDHYGNTICTRRLQIDTTGTIVDIYSGTHYVFIDSLRTTGEQLFAFLVDTAMEDPRLFPYPAAGGGYRSSADAIDGNGDYGNLYMMDGTTGAAVRVRFMSVNHDTAGGTVTGSVTRGNRKLWFDYDIGFTSSLYFVGRLPQALLSYYNGTANEMEWVVPLDDGITGVFRGTSWISTGAVANARFHLRKS